MNTQNHQKMNNHGFETIMPITLADGAYEKIRNAIILGELEFGEKLSELSLCEMFGISRSPIRSALTKLTSEGLIISQTNKSAYVWNPTSDDVLEIISLRRNLEMLASEIIISKIDEQDCMKMKEIIKMQERAIEENNFLELIHLDRKFHYLFVSKSNHSRLIKVWQMIMGQWEVLMHKRYKVNPILTGSVPEDHNEILNAFCNRNLETVNKLHYQINDRVTKELIASFI